VSSATNVVLSHFTGFIQQVMSQATQHPLVTRELVPPKFAGDDYETWAARMRAVLIFNDLWAVVDGAPTLPSIATPTASAAATTTDAATTADSTASAAAPSSAAADTGADAKDQKAYGLIASCLSDGLLVSFAVSETSGRALWAKLRAAFAPRSLGTAMQLRAAWSALSMGDEDVAQYVARVKQLRDRLAAAGVQLGDDDVVYKLLVSLPPAWAPLVTALSIQDQLPLAAVEARLIHHQQLLQLTQGATALTVSARPVHQRPAHPTPGEPHGPRRHHQHYCALHGPNSNHTTEACKRLKQLRDHQAGYRRDHYPRRDDGDSDRNREPRAHAATASAPDDGA